MKRMNWLVILTVLAFSNVTAFGQLIVVDFGGTNMVSQNQALGLGVDLANPISPSSGYNGQAFYGGITEINAPVAEWQISNDIQPHSGAPLGDWIRASRGATEGADAKFHHALIFFKQADFLNYGSLSGGVTLNEDTPMSFYAKRTSGNPSEIGFVLQTSEQDNPFYIYTVEYNDSQQGGGAGHLLSLSDPTSVQWQSYDPLAGLNSIGANATPDFTKVTGMGVWFENERAGNNNAGLTFHVTDIEFSAIPEPSTMSLVLASLLGLLAARFRRRAA